MPSVHRDPRRKGGLWFAYYRLADGRRVCRSTGKYNKREAEIVAEALQAAENEAATGELTRDRFTELLRETFQRLGVALPEKVSVRGWLRDWLASCKGATEESTYLGYQHAVREFLAFLGTTAASRSITGITLETINGFRDKLLEEGRSASTVNKLIKKYLNTPFELARKSGKISFNPINGFRTLKVESGTKAGSAPSK